MIPSPELIVKPFASEAAGGNITLPIPIAPTVTPGQASFDLGFPPVTMLDPVSEAGVPPFGQDFNGIFYTITSYLAWLQSGGGFFYEADFVAEWGGYDVGAELRSTTNDSLRWLNTVADNATDPDDSLTAVGWIALTSGGEYLSVAVSAGTTNNFAPAGLTPAVSYLDLDTTAGNATITSIAGGFNGRKLIISNSGANLLTLPALGGGSANNQFRLPSDFLVVQNQSVAFEYVGGISKWIAP